jgi:hydroxyacylglutathione hydrolase
MSYVACETKRAPTPWGVFTGDSLFVNSAGRPDLMGHDQVESRAEQLYDTLYSFFMALDDDVIIYPGHGQGSPCGANIGDRLTSTIGYEWRCNPFLQLPDQTAFKDYVMSTAPPEPTYYKRMKRINAAGPEVLGRLPVPRGLPPAAVVFRQPPSGRRSARTTSSWWIPARCWRSVAATSQARSTSLGLARGSVALCSSEP